MKNWEPVAFKSLLRTTSQRLGQLQERKDSQGQLMRRDIAMHLSQGHIALARAKAATMIQEDMMGDLLEELEMLVGGVGSHVEELGGVVGLGLGEDVKGRGEEDIERGGRRGGHTMRKPPRLSPALVEAAASIIHAAPSTECKDLDGVVEILIQRLGPTFVQTASASRNNHVSPRIMQILSSPPPTASRMDGYLVNIAQTHGVDWVPEPRREDLLDVISEILRVGAGSSPIVDLPRLREVCARGLPDHPPWVRPRIWRLLLGTLPVLKTTWTKESQKQRDNYYDLVRRVLDPLASLSSPTDPLSPTDALIARTSDSLFHVSPDLFSLLGNEPNGTRSGRCPLDANAPDAIRILCASNLDKRLALLQGKDDSCGTPEIRLESDPASPSPPSSSTATTFGYRRQHQPTTLLPSKAYNAPPAHRGHLSALLRLLYLHSMLNPAVQSPHVPWLLVPLYSALVGEVDEGEVAHAEADTFWVFETLVGEISEMEEEEGGKLWRRRLSERIKWADGELATSLHATGLDPAFPHYSYRWLAPLLTQTLPLSSVFPVWDVLFACPMRTRNANPKLERIVDICTTLLICARTPLFRLGKPGKNVPGLWTQVHATLPPPSPLRPWELSDAFTEGIALLTSYPIDAAGGVDRILQMALDLTQKRLEARERERERERENVGFGARIKQQMWKGFTNQVADGSPDEEDAVDEEEDEDEEDDATGEHDDGNETETPAAPTLTSRLATTVWRGITNQSSMDDDIPSPPSPSSSRDSPTPPEEQEIERMAQDLGSSTPSSPAGLWGYAGKLKDSDTVAAFSKASSNWRAKALDAWRVRKGSDVFASSRPVVAGQSTLPNVTSETGSRQNGWPGLSNTDAPTHRLGSLPGLQSEDTTLDPPRPAFFRSPRESFLPQPRRQHNTPPASPSAGSTLAPLRDSDNESSSSSFIHRAGAAFSSISAFQSSHSTPKSVPRPLMLSSRDLITKSPQPQSHSSARSEGGTPVYPGGADQWGDAFLTSRTRHGFRQASVSSTSSLSPSEAIRSPRSVPGGYAQVRSDYESDGGSAPASRKVPLNRRTVSPMALASRSPRLPWNASPLSNEDVAAEGKDKVGERGWRRSDEQVQPSSSARSSIMTGMTTGFDSPTTIESSPVPRTPLMPAISGSGIVRIVNGRGTGGGGHVGTSSISTLGEASEPNMTPLQPPTQSRLLRKKTPPIPMRSTANNNEESGSDGVTLASESGDSEMAMSLEKTPMKPRSKRYASRSGNSRVLSAGTGTGSSELQTASPGRLAPEWPGESEPVITPRMETHPGGIGGGEERMEGSGMVLSRPPFVRKSSRDARSRKVSTGSRETRRMRDSGAEEGDDEGYDDLLSAYESEEGSRE